MTPEELDRQLAIAKEENDRVVAFIREQIEPMRKLHAKWVARLEKEKKHERGWLISLTALSLVNTIGELENTSIFLEHVFDIGAMAVRTKYELAELAKEIPEMGKTKDELIRQVKEEIQGLKDFGEKARKQTEEQKKKRDEDKPPSPPPRKGVYD